MADIRDFTSAYVECLPAVYGYFGYRVSSRELAEDLTHDTFERALAAWERFDSERSAVRTWTLAIAGNLLIDHHRRARHRESSPLPDQEHPQPPEMVVPPLDHDLGIDPGLAVALESLDQRARNLIALRYGGDLTGQEVAEVTGLTLANVQQILSRSLRKLRVELDRQAAVSNRPE